MGLVSVQSAQADALIGQSHQFQIVRDFLEAVAHMTESAHVFSCVEHGSGHHGKDGLFVLVIFHDFSKAGVGFRGSPLGEKFFAFPEVAVNVELTLQCAFIILFFSAVLKFFISI